MELSTLALLALVQGITEFLPVSSSGHLILLPIFLGVEDQGQAIDISVHVGTLGAVMLYFWRDMLAMLAGAGHIVSGRMSTPQAKLVLLLVLATIPVVILGLILSASGLSDSLRSMKVIGWTMLGFGIVLYYADKASPETRTAPDWTVRDAVVMGLWQALALIPGTSRSGATITASRFLGFERSDGAKLAMLMSIPTIIASAVLVGLDVFRSDDPKVWGDLAIAAGLSFVAALGALGLMMKFLKSSTFLPYVVYRVILGVVLLWFAYS